MEDIFMIWSDESEHIIKKFEKIAAKNNTDNFILHIFVPKNSTSVPRDQSWIVTHESLTSEEDAAKVSLVVFILKKYTSVNKKAVSKRRSLKRNVIYLVQHDSEDHEELAALLRSAKGGGEMDVKLLVAHSNSGRSTAKSDPQNSRPERHCKYCNVLIQDAIDGGRRLSSQNDKLLNAASFDSNHEGVGRLADKIISTSSCVICGKHRQIEQMKFIKNSDQNTRFARHNIELNGYANGQRNGKFHGNIAETHSQDNLIGDREVPVNGTSISSPCACFQDGGTDECSFCRRDMARGKYRNGLQAKHDRARSSEEYGIDAMNAECQCTPDGTKICFGCLLSKLSKPVPELKLGRSGSAPTIFFHGDFKQGNNFTKQEIVVRKETREIATNTENYEFSFGREQRKSVMEKSTNTVSEKSTNMVFEKSTATDDLEVHQLPAEVEKPYEGEAEVDFLVEVPESKKSLYSCAFCPDKAYRSKQLLEVHMRNNHKKCNCPCKQYFRTREDYLSHFYFVYPLPCLLDKKCPERFRGLYYQSLHHKETHHAAKPFFCIPCHRVNDEKGAAATFKDIASLKIHATSFGHDSQEMYLVNNGDRPDESRLPFSMRCSGINYC